MARAEIYVSTDIEADGPIPGPHSMLSFASAAFTADNDLVGTFSANLVTLPEASGDPTAMAWWATQPQAWAACRAEQQEPAVAMVRYKAWLDQLPGRPVLVGYPAAFDFMFVYWYLMRFAGSSPFSHSALDIKTYAMALLGTGYRATVKRTMPRSWFEDQARHTHVALDDAIEQGALFCAMLAANPQAQTAPHDPGI
ncbi:MAG: exonuclease [Dactylosporangium sp.]|nr:exonuclease [Dactylosporangium sp.]NNJ61838.1 exonuclease [Dactylosporangium sp.]